VFALFHPPRTYDGAMTQWDADVGVVRLPDGRLVRGTGRRQDRQGIPPPDFAVYLLGRDPRICDWPSRWVRWRDFGRPYSTDDAVDALREAHTRAATERVEIACDGGTGRTGTSIALLAVMSGLAPEDAVAWVRTHSRPRAVETPGQRRWIATASTLLAR
jgi:hypothetical protein